MTPIEQTAATLRPWLGSDFVAANAELMARLAFRLTHFTVGRDNLPKAAQDIDTALFMAVRDATGGRMILRLDDNRHMRVKVDDFAIMADELLYLLMHGLPRDEKSFLAVREYSVRHGSLAALRALYLDYQAFQTDEEWRTVERVIKTCHPPFRWRGWLTP